MNQRGVVPIIIVGVIAAAAVGAVAAYVLVFSDGGSTGLPEGENAQSITSVSCKMDSTLTTDTGTYTATSSFSARNLWTSNLELRVEATMPGVMEGRLILKESSQEAWAWDSESGWQDSSDEFESIWSMYGSQFTEVLDILSDWTGGDYNYTDPDSGASVRFYDIQLNVDLSDSLFEPS